MGFSYPTPEEKLIDGRTLENDGDEVFSLDKLEKKKKSLFYIMTSVFFCHPIMTIMDVRTTHVILVAIHNSHYIRHERVCCSVPTGHPNNQGFFLVVFFCPCHLANAPPPASLFAFYTTPVFEMSQTQKPRAKSFFPATTTHH